MENKKPLNDKDLDIVSGGDGSDSIQEEVSYYGYRIDPDYCVYCGACVMACPADAIEEIGGKFSIDSGKCVTCGSCANQCPVGAIFET